MRGTDRDDRFENVDWSEITASKQRLSTERAFLVVGILAVFVVYLSDRFVANAYLIGTWNPGLIDWAFLLSSVIVVAYGVVPLIKRRRAVQSELAQLRSRPIVFGALGFLCGVCMLGLLGPGLVSNPGLRFEHAFHPPVGFSTEIPRVECVGSVTGPPLDSSCHGSWTYPLGTNERGFGMGYLLIRGSRVTVYILVIAVAAIVPLAAAIGAIAGLHGGIVDRLLMSYVDLQLSIPAIVAYFIGYTYWNPSLLLLVSAFAVLSWGGVARLVRSEVLQRRERGHIRVARSLGASNRYIIARHIIPNITNTLIPAVCQLLALLILFEAGIAFLGFHHIELYSWGSVISESVNAEIASHLQTRAEYPAYRIWWVSTLPALALTTTILSLKLVGDGLRDILDPRGGQ
ncbi:ABC transporter permease [Natranaeroarchaeum aerophilus]|uniref:ABC transporter permease n=1 Tax=Natranaeroarchaeum aerophilus TaxID=2917711 RepID=A0AAE3FTL2_9EURY|nr:ABC transporter permease [Natranaeroarchaeum aerophilus]MCL9814890.1 ABC transporter permease [Natranaeroarchaeum aerophilus]